MGHLSPVGEVKLETCRAHAGSHRSMKAAMCAITSGSINSGAWPWSGTSSTSSCFRRARMSATVWTERRSDNAPRITSTGTLASESNCGHKSGIGLLASKAASVLASAIVSVGDSDALIKNVCNQAILLEKGKLIAIGPVDDILDRYHNRLDHAQVA